MSIRATIRKAVMADIIMLSIFLVGLSNMPTHLTALVVIFLPTMLVVNYLLLRKRAQEPSSDQATIPNKQGKKPAVSLYVYSGLLFIGIAYGILAIRQGEIPKEIAILFVVPIFLAIYFIRMARKPSSQSPTSEKNP